MLLACTRVKKQMTSVLTIFQASKSGPVNEGDDQKWRKNPI